MIQEDTFNFDILITDDDFKDDPQQNSSSYGTSSIQNEPSLQEIRNSFDILTTIVPQIFNNEFLAAAQERFLTSNSQTSNKNQQDQQQQPYSHYQNTAIPQISEQKRQAIHKFCTINQKPNFDAASRPILQEIIIQVFKRLQQYLQSQRMVQKPTPDSKLKAICTIGLHCQQIFSRNIINTFHNSIKGIYDIENYDGVTIEAALELYNHFIANLPKKQDSCKQNSKKNQFVQKVQAVQPKSNRRLSVQQQRYGLHSVWSQQHEKQLLMLYKSDSRFTYISKQMKELYPQQAQMMAYEALKCKFNNILKDGIKKIMNASQSKNLSKKLPELIKMNENRLRTILQQQKWRELRLLIIQIYERHEPDLKLLQNSIKSINESITKWQQTNKSMQKGDNSKPLYHPKFKNGKKYGKYNRPYEPNQKKKQKEDEAFMRKDEQDKRSDFDPLSDNESVYSIF